MNWMIPLMIGAPDMAFARMNNWSFWLLPPAAMLLIISLFVPGGGPGAGWTFYALVCPVGRRHGFRHFRDPLDGPVVDHGLDQYRHHHPEYARTGHDVAQDADVCLDVAGDCVFADCRRPGAGWRGHHAADRSPLRHALFFNAAGGGDPILFQHVFWFFGHPEVYIMALPAFGVVSQILPTFSRKPLFGYVSMVYAVCAIAILSFMVWGHHMFAVGFPATAQLFYMFMTMLIAVPTGVKVFNWISTMWQGSMTFETPMLFAIGFFCVCSPSAACQVWCCRWPRSISSCMAPITWWRTSITCWWRARCSACLALLITGCQVDRQYV